MLEYQTATKRDLSRLSRQLQESYKSAYRGMMEDTYLNSLKEDHWVPILGNTLDNGGSCLFAQEDGRIIGSAAYGQTAMEECEGYAELYAIYLLPQAMGRGIGHCLYERVERGMKARGYIGCVLEVLAQNERAIRFYRGHGFQGIREFTVQENGMELLCLAMKKDFK